MSDSKEKNTSPDLSGLSYNRESIAAVASGVGGAIAAIRVSGANIFDELSAVLDTSTLQNKPRMACYLRVVEPKSSQTIDDTVAIAYQGPASFTGENTIEIFCHGGPYIVSRIMTVMASLGIRQALPGEFTRRAFLNGKLDLTTAEGIKELVVAQTEGEWLAARQLSEGRLSQTINDLRKQLVKSMAYLEACIDFPDEGDTADANKGQAKALVDSVRESLTSLLGDYRSGQVAVQGLKVALVGPPNAGKSTMMNYFLDKERAIVTDIPGTTRDYLTERCTIKGRLIHLVDTAGIRDSNDVIESKGIEESRKWVEESDLCLALVPPDNDGKFLQEVKERATNRLLVVGTKSDQGQAAVDVDIMVSCQNGEAMSKLYDQIAEIADSYLKPLGQNAFLTNERQRSQVGSSLEAIDRFNREFEQGAYEECLAFELQGAAASLSEIVGVVENDDLLESVFSEFCVGK